MLHYLSPEEERAIKETIPWNNLDRLIREIIRLANKVEGIATVQSCEGHVHPKDEIEGFTVDSAHITFKATQERTLQILFDAAPSLGFIDVSLRYFGDATFWISIGVDPSERHKLYELIEQLGSEMRT